MNDAALRDELAAETASGVDTKHTAGETFGNDNADAISVDTKSEPCVAFGNDAIGFIRVRKRKLKGPAHPEWREYCAQTGMLATTAMSFDLVRAVRVNGKPRHQFMLGLGSQKDVERHGRTHCWFWASVVYRMTRQGLSDRQRRWLIAEMVNKGARLPTPAEFQQHLAAWPDHEPEINEVLDSVPNARDRISRRDHPERTRERCLAHHPAVSRTAAECRRDKPDAKQPKKTGHPGGRASGIPDRAILAGEINHTDATLSPQTAPSPMPSAKPKNNQNRHHARKSTV
jgi:hypothetical protein